MDPISVIPVRTSRRSYTSQGISPEQLEKINALIQVHQTGPLGSQASLTLVSRELESNKKLRLGTYGFIQGARYFLAGQSLPKTDQLLDYAYVLEHIILELTALGIGTCWLGGTFDRGEFSRAIDLKSGCVIPAITPVGIATSMRSLGDRIIRAGAGSKKRKDWEELFFFENSLLPYDPELKGSLTRCLDMVRLSPSASNNQPWRILVADHKVHFYLNRKPGYQRTFGAVDIQMLDIGIAMCHFELSAKHLDMKGQWYREDPSGTIFDWEYIISYKY